MSLFSWLYPCILPTFNHLSAEGYKKCFDSPPFQRGGGRLGEDGLEGFSMCPVHSKGMIAGPEAQCNQKMISVAITHAELPPS
jgi:hypothetical protein